MPWVAGGVSLTPLDHRSGPSLSLNSSNLSLLQQTCTWLPFMSKSEADQQGKLPPVCVNRLQSKEEYMQMGYMQKYPILVLAF